MFCAMHFVVSIYQFNLNQSVHRSMVVEDRYSPKRDSPRTVIVCLYNSEWRHTTTLLAMTVGLDCYQSIIDIVLRGSGTEIAIWGDKQTTNYTFLRSQKVDSAVTLSHCRRDVSSIGRRRAQCSRATSDNRFTNPTRGLSYV